MFRFARRLATPASAIVHGTVTGVFAITGLCTGAVIGAFAGRGSEGGALRGAGLGAVAGALICLEAIQVGRGLLRNDSPESGERSRQIETQRSHSSNQDFEPTSFMQEILESVLQSPQMTQMASQSQGRELFHVRRSGRRTHIPLQLLQALHVSLNLDNMSYDEIYETFGGPTSVPGVPQSVLNQLPSDVLDATEGCKAAQCSCTICLQDFEEGDTVRTLPRCSHMYHTACIDQWLVTQGDCPICRVAIIAEDSRSAKDSSTA
ncbi:hypothetical protein CYMTET_10518 [Cymbomonas tetramitiformis]|uniref:RING-type domain-containing protein n=1 Tax=Cymbomonas tetramitiformis TaxID=36881 RepID=A0AAE0GP66_9CHLO|nr:hypothetical protein CYMTET_10518 [Cymbomonas tetramitiformis]